MNGPTRLLSLLSPRLCLWRQNRENCDGHQHLFQFRCQCDHVEPIVLGRLDDVTRWTCERCGYSTDLTAKSYRGVIEELRDIASEVDKQVRQHGENVERIDG